MNYLSLCSALFVSASILSACNPQKFEEGSGSAELSEPATGTAYGSYKNFTCSVRGNAKNGRRELYSIKGKYRVHEVGGQYEIQNPVILRDDAIAKEYAVQLDGVNSAPLQPNNQTFFSGDNAHLHLNIQVTTNVQKDFQIKADVENRNSGFRQFGDCNFESFIAPPSSGMDTSASSRFNCVDGAVNPGGHRYVLRFQQHPKDINTSFEHFVDVVRADGTVTKVSLLLSLADSDSVKGTKVLFDKSRRLKVSLFNVNSMGSNFQASFSHLMKPPSVAEEVTARPVLNCSQGY